MDPGAGSSPGWLGREAVFSPQAASGEGDDRAATRLFSRAHPEAQVPPHPLPPSSILLLLLQFYFLSFFYFLSSCY